ncbi:MAG: hypothetical protein KAH84_00325 [Thiomargarita sp.]|nr:hypothetical protein [Thiomargarita sp.]
MKRFIVSSVMLFFLWLIYNAASLGIADVFINLARYDMQQWEKQKKIDDWEKTHSLVEKALFLTPNNPTYLEDMARIYYLQTHLGEINTLEKRQNLEKALMVLKQSARLRPTWAAVWANIVLIKFSLQQYDKLFFLAIENANTFGSGELFTQKVIVYVGLEVWYNLPVFKEQKIRAIILATIEQAMSSQARKIIPIIKNHPRKNIICFLRGHKPIMKKLCN